MKIEKTGMFTIAGKPNVGKSTLLNALAGEKVAIVSSKPQTTRTRISAVLNRGNTQYVFTDTPGFHKPKNRLGDFMVKITNDSVSDADAVLLVVEPESPGTQERVLIGNIAESREPCILVINKIDTVAKEELLAVIDEYTKLHEFDSVVMISARKRDGIEELIRELDRYTVEGEALYPEDMVTDLPERAVLAELVREKILILLDREVPHGTAVEIEKLEKSKNGTVVVSAVIYSEKETHKGIIIGKNGAMLKRIGELARSDMEKMYGCKVYLSLWVKIKEGWRDNKFFMRNFGYGEN